MAGDHDAFAALAGAAADRLYGLARMILRDPDRAEDATQEALVKAWRELPRLRDPDRFEAWLRRLLVNACYDEARRAGRRAEVRLIAVPEIGGGDPAPSFADQERVDGALRRIPVDQRAVLGAPPPARADARGDRRHARDPARHGQVAAALRDHGRPRGARGGRPGGRGRPDGPDRHEHPTIRRAAGRVLGEVLDSEAQSGHPTACWRRSSPARRPRGRRGDGRGTGRDAAPRWVRCGRSSWPPCSWSAGRQCSWHRRRPAPAPSVDHPAGRRPGGGRRRRRVRERPRARRDGTTLWVGCPTGIRRVDIDHRPADHRAAHRGHRAAGRRSLGLWATTIGGLCRSTPRAGRATSCPRRGHRHRLREPRTVGGDRERDREGRAADRARPGPRAPRRRAARDRRGRRPRLGVRERRHAPLVRCADAVGGSGDPRRQLPEPGRHRRRGRVRGQPGPRRHRDPGRCRHARGDHGQFADPSDPGSLGEIAATPAGVWVTRRTALLRLDPTTLEVISVTPLPGYPLGVAVIGDTAWSLSEEGHLDRARVP